jgi:hypothetical protein
MQKNYKLIVDTFCEVYDLLKPYADGEFWDFGTHDIIPGAVYLISRKEIGKHKERIREIIESNQAHIIFSNPAEGSETLIGQVYLCNLTDLAQAGKMLLLGGGDMDGRWTYLNYASFMPKILDYEENIQAASRSPEIFNKKNKPYKFLFLNGRMRSHRKYLIERFHISNLIQQSLWTALDSREGPSKHIKFIHKNKNLMYDTRPHHYLPKEYEVDRYQSRIDVPTNNNFVKYELFNDTWGEIYLKAEPYIDTYFSLVTETIFEYPHSFRTEKIWKPIVMGHPWICAANYGFYRDLKNEGYRTFGNLIDESFDLIENNQDRIERIAAVVEHLCQQDLPSFLEAAEETCKYNQQRYAEHRVESRTEFPSRFFQFVNKHINE